MTRISEATNAIFDDEVKEPTPKYGKLCRLNYLDVLELSSKENSEQTMKLIIFKNRLQRKKRVLITKAFLEVLQLILLMVIILSNYDGKFHNCSTVPYIGVPVSDTFSD